MSKQNIEAKDQELIEEICDQLVNDLKELRELKGWTTAQLSEKTRIAQSNITRIETGGTSEKPQRPTLRTIATIAHALGAKVKLVTDKEGDLQPLKIEKVIDEYPIKVSIEINRKVLNCS